jgi:signal peptidase I
MTVSAPSEAEAETSAEGEYPYGTLRFVGGVVGRTMLWLACAGLAVTLLPMLLGWRPFVVKSGSMEPRIGVGDVVLAAPNHNPKTLLNHVAVFADPAMPGAFKSHRIVGVNPSGQLVTKGDANPTADPLPVPMHDVIGLGRVLVPRVGDPLVWLQGGRWLPLLLLLLAAAGVGWLVARDQEDDTDSPGPRIVLISLAGAVLLVVPGASAAFSRTAGNTADSWSVSSQRYTAAVRALGPYLYWQMNDASSTVTDSSGNGHPGTVVGGFTTGGVGATPEDTPNTSVALTNALSCVNTNSLTAIAGPSTFSEVVWFKSAASYNQGGKLIGFENPNLGIGIAGVTSTYDRQIFMDGAGKVSFGVYNGALSGAAAYVNVTTAASYNDGSWHMAVATLGASGMALYVDGRLRASGTNTIAQTATGFWRVGCGNLGGWGAAWTGPNNPDQNLISGIYNAYFIGSVDEAAVFAGSALTATQVAQLYFAR